MPISKPKTYCADLGRLPAALLPLTREKRWVVWRWTYKDGKWTKPPFKANNPSDHAQNDDPATWSSYDAALAAVAAGKADGIGYALTGDGLGAFDLDHCRDPQTEKFADWAQKIIDEAREAGAYIEVSVSGTGARVIGRCSIAAEKWPREKFKIGSNGESIEIYRKATRYITVSGLEVSNGI
jgi:primase-polymerase (primpol)-like protein